MRKSIVATFGSVLASGFLMVSAPVAHAGVCDGETYDYNFHACIACIKANQGSPPGQSPCYGGGVSRLAPGQMPTNGPAVGCDEAARQSGLPCVNP
jgi:hypothetical protein